MGMIENREGHGVVSGDTDNGERRLTTGSTLTMEIADLNSDPAIKKPKLLPNLRPDQKLASTVLQHIFFLELIS